MASSKRRPNYGRRIAWLGVAVLLLVGGYTTAWFWLAGRLESEAEKLIANVNRDGVSLSCARPEARGYPFRIGLFCDGVAFADAREGIGVTAGAFRSAGQVYDPFRIVAEIDGPAAVEAPRVEPLRLDWDGLRASVRIAQPLPERISVEGRGVTAALASGERLGSVGAFQAHLRPNGDDLDLAGSVEALAVEARLVEGRVLPALSGRSDLTIANGVALVRQPPATGLRGQSGTIRTLDLSTGPETGLSLSGPFSIGDDGLLDAKLTLTVRDPRGLSMALAGAFPEASDQILSGFVGLQALGDRPTLPLVIVKGKATLGFVPLGQIPPI